MQGWHLYVFEYSVSVFSNSVSMLIVTLGLLGYSNSYQATVTMAHNNLNEVLVDYLSIWSRLLYYHTADPASASGSSLVCRTISISRIYIAIGISGRFERHFSK